MNTTLTTLTTATIAWQPCRWCGNVMHMGECPRVKVIEYYPNGTIKRVEFHGYAAPICPDPLVIISIKGVTS